MSKRRFGFTLVELLVVVAIVALLVAILLPALGLARKKGKTALCLSNVRGLGMAAQMYVAEWQKYLPWYNTATYGPNYWVAKFQTYGQIDKMRICPEALDHSALNAPSIASTSWVNAQYAGTDPLGKPYVSSYTPNAFCMPPIPPNTVSFALGDDTWFWKAPYMASTSQIPVFGDGTWVDAWPHVNAGAPNTVTNPDINNSGALLLGRFTINRHEMAINVAFMDGHGQTTKLPDLYTLKWNTKVGTSLDPIPNPLPKMPRF